MRKRRSPRSIELQPESVEAVAALAEAEAGLGNFDEAAAHAQRALERAPASATANLVMGLMQMEQRNYADARDALLKAVAGDPESPKVTYQLSLVYARLGDDASAQRYLEMYQENLAASRSESRRCAPAGRSATPRYASERQPTDHLTAGFGAAAGGGPCDCPPAALRRSAHRGAGGRAVPRHHSRLRHHLRAPRRSREEIHRRVDERRRGALRLRQRRPARHLLCRFAHRRNRQDPKAARSALYRNLGKLQFEDVTDKAGVGHPGWGMGVCTADVDGDGWEDLYVTALGGNKLYRNNRDGTFADMTAAPGAGAAAGRRAAASRTTTAMAISTYSSAAT